MSVLKSDYSEIGIINIIPYHDSVKYLGMNLDAYFKWREHIRELDVKFKKVYWLLERKK